MTSAASRGMSLDRLLEAVGLADSSSWSGEWPRITGVASDSRRVRDGDLFVAIAGERFDGRRFVPTALEAGAVAVLGPAPDQPFATSVPWIEVDDPRSVMAALSRRVYGNPADTLRLLGITGTNGKSSVVTMLGPMLEASGEPAARLGTIGYDFGDRQWSAGGRTTPEASDLHRLLAEMKDAGARAAAMEVSSHALELGRVEDVRFDLAAFTNLSRDHLDFHGDLESYFAAKTKLFAQLKPGGVSVVHVESAADAADWGHRLAQMLRDRGQSLLTCGDTPDADVHPISKRLDLDGIDVRLATPSGEIRLQSPLLGRFQLLNLLTAAACGVALGLPKSAIERGLGAVDVVPGRLEKVPGSLPALVDYAHTPTALEAVLASTRELSERPIVVVFGCGGERDRGKRPQMARAAGLGADLPILTSDNPRREDPLRIIAEAEVGLVDLGESGPHGSGPRDYLVEPDRRAAIELAVAKAREIDGLVLVAGKGHEATQDLGDVVVAFDDRLELARALGSEVATSGPTTSGPATSGPVTSGPATSGRSMNASGSSAGVFHG